MTIDQIEVELKRTRERMALASDADRCHWLKAIADLTAILIKN